MNGAEDNQQSDKFLDDFFNPHKKKLNREQYIALSNHLKKELQFIKSIKNESKADVPRG
jgi:hypothetical protein